LLDLRGQQNTSPLKNPLVLSQPEGEKYRTFRLNEYIYPSIHCFIARVS